MKHYADCDELPLFNFIKIVVTGDYRWLWKNKDKTDGTDLKDVWTNITEEYNECSGNLSYKSQLALSKQLTFINNKLVIIQAVVDFLMVEYNKDLCDLLRSMGFVYKYDPADLYKDLKLTISSAKRLVVSLREAEIELNAMEEKQEKPSESNYLILIAQLSKFLGFKIPSKKTSVKEFVSYLSLAEKGVKNA